MAFLRPAYYADSEMDFRVFVASLLWGFGRVVEITIGRRAKVIIPGGYTRGVYPGGIPGGYPGGVIAEMEFRPIKGWPKRAHYGD